MSDDGALERLAKKLNTKEGVPEPERSQVYMNVPEAPRGWEPGIAPVPRKRWFRLTALETVFAASIVFFVIALAVAGLLFFSGNNTVSTKNVDIAIAGPTEIGAGDTIELQIVITNRNAVPMELPDLIVEFPDGTRSDVDISKELPRIRKALGTIEAGASVKETVRAVLFGQEGNVAEVKASVEYHVPSSNAIFVAEATYEALINKAPASITVDSLKEAVAGQLISFTVRVRSNTPDTLSNIVLLAEYPPGFTFQSASPGPVSGTVAWNLGDIEPGGERSVIIRGKFAGEDQDTRVLHFTVGSKKAGQEGVIAAPLATTEATVTISKPFVGVVLALDGDIATERSIARGVPIRGDIRWENNLPVRVEDVEIEVLINGAILDRNKVTVERGFFRSSANTIVWSSETDSHLKDVEAGASGVSSFTFSTLPPNAGTFRNPELTLTVTVRARRVSEANVPEIVESTAVTHVRIMTDLALTSLLSRSGAFANTGPIPPKADAETMYTVTWLVSNSANAVANATVSAVLPSYVRYTSQVSPGNASVSFNPVGGIVTWNIGDIAAGESKTVAFQIGFMPSVNQVGTLPTLVSEQRISGFDRFVRSTIGQNASPLTSGSFGSQNEGLVAP